MDLLCTKRNALLIIILTGTCLTLIIYSFSFQLSTTIRYEHSTSRDTSFIDTSLSDNSSTTTKVPDGTAEVSCPNVNKTSNGTLEWIADFLNEAVHYEIIRYPSHCHCQHSKVLIGVLSNAINKQLRHSIRTTYADPHISEHVKNKTIVVIFIVGYPSDAVELKSVLEESELHDDILLTSIREAYSNLPLKTHSLFQYKEYFCKNAQYLAKTDDDVVIDIDRLASSLDRFRGENSIFGNMYDDSAPVRDPHKKWYVPEELYQRNKYPVYVGGIFYLVTSDAVGKILRNVNETWLIPIEDLLFTGIIASLANITRIDERRSFAFVDRKSLPGYWPCDANNQPFLIAEHDTGKVDAETLLQKYDRLKKIKCSKLPFMIFSLACKYLNICY